MRRVLEVVFAGSFAAPVAGEAFLQSPTLMDVSAKEMSWTVTLPPGWAARQLGDAESRVADGRHVISLVQEGPEGHLLKLAVAPPRSDSFWRRFLLLAVLLAVGGGLFWAKELKKRRQETPVASSPTSQPSS
jgi:hypothetical protein